MLKALLSRAHFSQVSKAKAYTQQRRKPSFSLFTVHFFLDHVRVRAHVVDTHA